MQYEPIIKLKPELDDMILEKKKGLVYSCPAKVFKLNDKTNNIEVVNQDACMYCGECTKFMA